MTRTDDPNGEPPEHGRSLIERLRGTGVGVEDPNIIGDAGPTDVAPGQDPPLPPLDEDLPPEEETPSERLLPSDEDLPADVAEPVGAVEPVDAVEPADAVEPFEPVEPAEVEVVEVIVVPAEEPAADY